MYDGSETVDRITDGEPRSHGLFCICSSGHRAMMHMHSPDGSTFLREMMPWPPAWKYDVKSKIRLRQSMHIYMQNNPAKFHPDPIQNCGALGFL